MENVAIATVGDVMDLCGREPDLSSEQRTGDAETHAATRDLRAF